MIAVQILLIAVVALLADADECSCSCNEQDVCEEQNKLKMEQDTHADEIQKWNKHYNFMSQLNRTWQKQVANVVKQQLEVGMDKTLEECLKNVSQKEVCKQKEDLIPRIQSLENSMRAIREREDELDLAMEKLSEMNAKRTELCPIQRGPKCGVDFDSGVSNGGGNTSSVLVWPWMAAVYRNHTVFGYEHVCGGSVIHRHFVLTSAWCVDSYGSAVLSVKLGFSDLKNGSHLREHRLQSTHTHPQFKTTSGTNYDYNVGLLELEEPIPFGPFVRPVCLPPREIPQGDPFYNPQSTAKAVRLDAYLSSPLTASPTVFNPWRYRKESQL